MNPEDTDLAPELLDSPYRVKLFPNRRHERSPNREGRPCETAGYNLRPLVQSPRRISPCDTYQSPARSDDQSFLPSLFPEYFEKTSPRAKGATTSTLIERPRKKTERELDVIFDRLHCHKRDRTPRMEIPEHPYAPQLRSRSHNDNTSLFDSPKVFERLTSPPQKSPRPFGDGTSSSLSPSKSYLDEQAWEELVVRLATPKASMQRPPPPALRSLQVNMDEFVARLSTPKSAGGRSPSTKPVNAEAA
mmetsp:Transcript_19047/g.31208  ORF Transcript_19047/g.31208 Transcript_19047/m.31208 type:complete len:247 (+) Transcript_19047:153-893(+)|eukprot:CAMPEP_0184658550 /NCGR_PEP_ID=MMETSP0308-20130426/25871_1 /TAXON_ID=38269 /ORGANISM="Gloeochaete witrockiana, Strain SAG 46.84" /LENGTH=246 /DNA_ID=CAMNT_0027097627 /DNA_START=106 /DNA_END=846 /DNA_ORIENTATION=+